MSDDTPTRQYEDVQLWTMPDRARYAELSNEVQVQAQIAESQGPRAMGDDDSAPVMSAKAMQEFIAEADTRARTIRVIALKRSEWRAMKAKHPIRVESKTTTDAEGNQTTAEVPHVLDSRNGFNVESVADDLVPASIAADFPSAAARDEFIDDLSEPDFDDLYGAALRVNEVGFEVPKAGVSLRLDQIIGGISNSPSDSD